MMNANTGPSYLFNLLRSGARPLGQASLGLSRHSINEISGRTGQTPPPSLELNHEGPGADSHLHPTPSTITDIAVKSVEVEGREASSHYLPEILQTGDGDLETTSHTTTTHTEERGSERSDLPFDRFAASQTGRGQTRSDPEPAIGRPEPETPAVSAPFFEPAASFSDRIPLQQERRAPEAEIERGLASLRSKSSPTVVEPAPFLQPETEQPAATEKGLSEVEHRRRQSGRRIFRVIEEDQGIARKEAGTASLRTEAYRPGMFNETLPHGAPISSTEIGASAGQASSGESQLPAQPAAAAQPSRAPRLISAVDIPIVIPRREAQTEPALTPRVLSPSLAAAPSRPRFTPDGAEAADDRIKDRPTPPRRTVPDDPREKTFNEALRGQAAPLRQESTPKLTIHRLEVQVINQSGQSGQSGQVSHSSADRARSAFPAPSLDALETLERHHLGRLL
jgi:hypothetical protein